MVHVPQTDRDSCEAATMYPPAVPYQLTSGSHGHRANDNGGASAKAPVAGGELVDLSPEEVSGVWSLRFGKFGCPDSELRGGVVHVDDGCVIGGDSHFAYLGQWWLKGTELKARLDIARHSDQRDGVSIFDGQDGPYRLDCVAEAITADLFEGRIQRIGFPDARVTMRRLTFNVG